MVSLQILSSSKSSEPLSGISGGLAGGQQIKIKFGDYQSAHDESLEDITSAGLNCAFRGST